MTDRERIAHLYRRLAFGASVTELDAAEKVGFERTLDRLIKFDPSKDGAVDPWQFVWREKEEADVGAWRFRVWWVHQMVTTPNPVQEKLSLFWHSHFAVGDDKVEDGPMILDYIQSIRKNANGKFRNLLGAIAFNPAMMRYLDMNRSLRGRPNENWARELMELFTLGIGHYTEQDVKEVSRAFTGYGYINTYWEMPGNADQRVKDALADGRPFSAATFMPTMRDDKPKTILGKTKDWTAEECLDLFAEHPQTARFVARKMWEFFAYDSPEEKTVDRIAAVFRKSKGDITQTLMAIAKAPEFWSDKCVRQMPKSPADLCIGIARQQHVGEPLAAALVGTKPNAPIPKLVLDQSGFLAYKMSRMGLTLLSPPDVAGWKWGSAWITPSNMAERFTFHGLYVPEADKVNHASVRTVEFLKRKQPVDPTGLARGFAEFYDVELRPETEAALASHFQRAGGIAYLDKRPQWDGVHWGAVRLLFAAPEMQLA